MAVRVRYLVSFVSADPEHLELLRRGPRAWNAWRRQNPSIAPNLTRIYLSVSERQMGQVNGGPVNLASARLRRASLRFATLSGADLSGADLSGADLTDARLDRANLANADLSGALLEHTDFTEAKLAGTNLCGTNLSKARNLTEAQLAETIGNDATVLPPHLKAPDAWRPPEIVPVKAEPETPSPATIVPPRPRSSRGNVVSWLVGGPVQTA
jgi:hypothetical protein